jgi:hypothetical protein
MRRPRMVTMAPPRHPRRPAMVTMVTRTDGQRRSRSTWRSCLSLASRSGGGGRRVQDRERRWIIYSATPISLET